MLKKVGRNGQGGGRGNQQGGDDVGGQVGGHVGGQVGGHVGGQVGGHVGHRGGAIAPEGSERVRVAGERNPGSNHWNRLLS